MSSFILPVGTETSLGTLTLAPGQGVSVSVDRTVSPNAITAKPLNSLTSGTSVMLRAYASQDSGATWYVIAACTATAGTVAPVVDPDTGQTIYTATTDVLTVNTGPGEEMAKVTGQMASTAAVSNAGIGAILAVS
jgi:hypothetical protein